MRRTAVIIAFATLSMPLPLPARTDLTQLLHPAAGFVAGQAPSWSPALGLQSVAAIPGRLAQPFPAPLALTLGAQPVTAANCTNLIVLRGQGATTTDDRTRALERRQGAVCLAIALLKSARPARTSSLSTFQLAPADLRLLPPSLAASFGKDDDADAVAQEAAGKSLHEAQPGVTAKKQADGLVLHGRNWTTHLQILARGDFNGDGVEDLLVSADDLANQGGFASTRLFLLTRTNATGPLKTLKRLQ